MRWLIVARLGSRDIGSSWRSRAVVSARREHICSGIDSDRDAERLSRSIWNRGELIGQQCIRSCGPKLVHQDVSRGLGARGLRQGRSLMRAPVMAMERLRWTSRGNEDST